MPDNDFTGNGNFDNRVSGDRRESTPETVKVIVNSTLALPNLEIKDSPTNISALPRGFDVFVPSVVGNSNSATNSSSPQIAEWTRTGQRGETLVLTGARFSTLTGTKAGTDTKFWVYGQTNNNNGVLVEATLQRLDGNIAAITLPQNLPRGSSFLVWVENNAGYSQPVMINQTETWWIQETATRGQVASVFGRNLSQNGGTQKSHVYLEDSTGKGYWAKIVAVNPYKVDFKVPQGLAQGDYKVFVHNGDGGQYGWSKPLMMTVNEGLNYTGPVFNVKDFGAKGDGITDDSQAIQAAIREADRYHMSTVYLPSGTYVTSESLFLGWDKVRWMGAGKNATTIKAADGFDQYYLFQGDGRNQITFQNLTLDANHDRTKILNTVTHIRNSSDLQYINVKIDAEGTSPFDWHSNNGVLMKNSEVIGQGSFLGNAQQLFIDKTKFFGTGYTDTLLHGFGTQMVSITNSTAQNLDTSDPNNGKWVKGRFFIDQSHWGISQNQYFGNNKTINLAPPPADFDNDGNIDIDRNSGEQIMWETEGSVSLGAVTAATKNTVTFKNPYRINQSWQLTIVQGKGMGQSRTLESFNSSKKTYEIQGEWNVIPDRSSVIVASKIPSNIVVYNNSFDGTAEAYHSPTHVASAGVQTYHGSANLIIDHNTFHELRTGVSLWSGSQGMLMPDYFTQVSNNTFKDDLTGISFPWISGNQGTSILGSTIRKNNLDKVETAFSIQMNPNLPSDGNSFPNVNMNIYENNTLGRVDEFLSISQTNDNIHNNIILNNNFLQNNINFINDSN